MRLSYVLITHNRRERLLLTLQRLVENTGLPRESWEALVVDNASRDGTAAAVRRQFPWATVLELTENEGMPARNHAFREAKGRYVVLLDDDSYPAPGAISAGLSFLARRMRVAGLVARVVLPDGRFEAPAFPAVLLGGASILRRSVLDEVGGFATEFFRQAEEYDLSFRIWQAGFSIERFEDVIFHHDKDNGGARSSALTHRMDLRNNLILVERYLPRMLRRAYRHDWIQRYARLAMHEGHRDAVDVALREARIWARREFSVGRRTLDGRAIELLFDLQRQARTVTTWRQKHRLSQVVIADFSKNLYATWKASQAASLKTLSLADDRAAFSGRRYRGVPILPTPDALDLNPDGIIISTVNPAHLDAREQNLRRQFDGPILRLWKPSFLDSALAIATPSAA